MPGVHDTRDKPFARTVADEADHAARNREDGEDHREEVHNNSDPVEAILLRSRDDLAVSVSRRSEKPTESHQSVERDIE